MKKFIVSLLVFSLALSPLFCLGQREVGLKTIFLRGDSAEVSQSLSEKPTQPSSVAVKSETNSTESKNSAGNSAGEMTTEEIVTELVTTTVETKEINQGALKALAVISSENTTLKAEIDDASEYIETLETDLDLSEKANQDKDVELAKKKGEIDTLNEKLKARKSYKSLLVGAEYNLVDGYSVGLDFGVKFNGGLTTQVGVKLPLSDINPIGALDINNYTVSTSIGWSW